MTIKIKRLKHMTLIGLFAITFIGCESHEQQSDKTMELVKQVKLLSNDSQIAKSVLLAEPVQTGEIKKAENPDEWMKFKIETETKIRENERKINQIRTLPGTTTKLLKQVSNLEQENNDLRKKMDNYREEEKVRWETFKTIINHEVNNIDIELKNTKLNASH